MHPERNSTSILRADILSDTQAGPSSNKSVVEPTETPTQLDFQTPIDFIDRRRIRRKLLPRKPNLDKPLEQDCIFLAGNNTKLPKGLVILLPDAQDEQSIPFYHPKLKKLAFHYVESTSYEAKNDPDTVPQGTIKISALPFPTSESLLVNKVQEGIAVDVAPEDDVNRFLAQRTIRTCMHLLETLYKHAWGQQRGYEKRVVHDVSRTLIKHPVKTRPRGLMIIKHIRAGFGRARELSGLVPGTQGAT